MLETLSFSSNYTGLAYIIDYKFLSKEHFELIVICFLESRRMEVFVQNIPIIDMPSLGFSLLNGDVG